MRILLPYEKSLSINIALAKEIGLFEATSLLRLYEEIQKHGLKKNGLKQIARTDKQIREILDHCKPHQIKSIIERLRVKEYIIVSDETLFDNDSLWYGLNWQKLREIKSLVVMGDDEIEESHITPTLIKENPKVSLNGSPRIHQILFGAFLVACHWDDAPALLEKDKSEVGAAVNALIKSYPDHDMDDLKIALLKFDEYRINILKQERPLRPFGIMRAWTDYAKWYNSKIPKKG